jgi:hypothetical protein
MLGSPRAKRVLLCPASQNPKAVRWMTIRSNRWLSIWQIIIRRQASPLPNFKHSTPICPGCLLCLRPTVSSLLKNRDIAVSAKRERRRGATKEHVLRGPVTEEQRSRRSLFAETLRAEDLLLWGFVARQSKIHANILLPRSAPQSKISLSGDVHIFQQAARSLRRVAEEFSAIANQK